jgi:hypothetical protein
MSGTTAHHHISYIYGSSVRLGHCIHIGIDVQDLISAHMSAAFSHNLGPEAIILPDTHELQLAYRLLQDAERRAPGRLPLPGDPAYRVWHWDTSENQIARMQDQQAIEVKR